MQFDVIMRTDHRVRSLREHRRIFVDFRTLHRTRFKAGARKFFGVLAIILADAENIPARPLDRRQQPHVGQCERRTARR